MTSSSSSASASSPIEDRKPFEAALSGELRRFEQLTVLAWQGLWGIATAASLVAAATVSARIGLACAMTSAFLLGAHGLLGWLLARRRRRRALRVWLLVLEGASPWLLLLVLLFAGGADYALASWAPPMLFCGLCVAFAARLEPWAALLTGVGAGIVYPILFLAFAESRLSTDAAAQITFQLPMQLFRAVSLVAGGVLGNLAARGLRSAFERADVSAREQDLFGKYRLVRQIAAGGMGVVYDAMYQPQGGFARRVALKRIHEHLAEQARFVEAFRDEAEICARLAHPNVVQVVDFGRVGSSYFLAMEYVDGLPLSRLFQRASITRAALPAHVVGLIGRELLAALQYAHAGARDPEGRRLRIVHRDVCPENIMVSRNGEVKLTDFGVARALKDAAATHTRSAGHIAYMAPEQARGEAVDPRADLFAVGVVLWELLAGRRLFKRENDPATLVALLSEAVTPITALRGDLDRGWDHLLTRALARPLDKRFHDAKEMAAALAEIPGSSSERAADELAALIEQLQAEPEPVGTTTALTVTG